MIVGTDGRAYEIVASDAAPIPRTAGGDREPNEDLLPKSPCPRSAGVRARGSAERGQDRARGSARTCRVARDGARWEGVRREGMQDAWRSAQGSAAARTNRGRG
jgi:hypothetical protein